MLTQINNVHHAVGRRITPLLSGPCAKGKGIKGGQIGGKKDKERVAELGVLGNGLLGTQYNFLRVFTVFLNPSAPHSGRLSPSGSSKINIYLFYQKSVFLSVP